MSATELLSGGRCPGGGKRLVVTTRYLDVELCVTDVQSVADN